MELDPVVLEYNAHTGYCCWLPLCIVYGTRSCVRMDGRIYQFTDIDGFMFRR